MKHYNKCLYLIFLSALLTAETTVNILSSSEIKLVIQLNCDLETPEDLKPIDLLIGLPNENLPQISIHSDKALNYQYQNIVYQKTEWTHQQKVNGLNTGTLRISPHSVEGFYSPKQTVTIRLDGQGRQPQKIAINQQKLLSPKITNWAVAKNWVEPKQYSLAKLRKFPAGRWIKFSISKDNVYKISADRFLATLGTGESVDPRSIMLFTGSSLGRDRTFDLTQKITGDVTIPENLVELAIAIEGESDGNLDSGDKIIFYGQGPSGFDQQVNDIFWHENLYFTESVYWLFMPEDSALRGKRITTGNSVPDGPLSVDYGFVNLHFETDIVNHQESGLAWGNSIIRQGGSFSQDVHFIDPMASIPASGSFGLIGKESVATRYYSTKHTARLSFNNQALSSITWSNLGLKSGDFSIPAGDLSNGIQSFQISNIADNPNSEPLYDYLTISYARKLSYASPFEFVSPVTENNITFSISGSNLTVWNITDPKRPVNTPILSQDDFTLMRVSLPPDTLQRFYTFQLEDVSTIENLSLLNTKHFSSLRDNLNGSQHIIVGPETFRIAAQPLVDHRNQSIYASIEDIYDEFSGGNKDPVAIRHFLQWTQNHWAQKPSTVLFMGDADFDYRNITGQSKMQVPTIQVGSTYSHATDDRLVSFNGVIPEMATGRFPARTLEEVTAFVEKTIAFETSMPNGLWKQRITLVADDPARPERESYELSIGKSHTLNSERLTNTIPGFMEIKKLYMVDFPEVSDGSAFGVIKPAATQALFDQITAGTAFINFIGHGNPTQWAQEKMLILNNERNDINSMHAEMKLPLWVAGTCNWGHFDQIGSESFAEELIRTPMDAASAIITTTRGITVSSNIQYLEKVFSAIFPGNSVTDATLGMVLQSVKTGGADGELFHLFGDPAMKLPIPTQIVNDATVSPDTLATLEVGTLNGSSPFSEGNGYLVFEDGATSYTQSFNFASRKEEITYMKSGPTLFRGSFTFEGASLSPQFRVPKDITYSQHPAKVRFAITSILGDEAIGAVTDLQLTLGVPSNDTNGPIITFETESGRMLRNGDHLPDGEKLIIRLSDPLGINLTGEKGHELFLYNPNLEEISLAIDQFIYDINSLNTGTIQYSIPDNSDQLSLGISAWDNANNPTEAEISLTLLKTKQLSLLHVYNYPNPFDFETQFTFELTADADVSVDIYTLEGRRIKSLLTEYYTVGYHRISWDGRDEYGGLLANGVYIYKMRASDGIQQINHIGRLAVFR